MSDYTSDVIEAARGNPVYASDGEKIGQVEEIFCDHQTDKAEWVGGSGGGQTAEGDAVTRSEEELRVGTREQEAGQARLRKRVETEPVQMDVELKRETVQDEVRKERVDIDGDAA